jgi:hypothetical protein
MAANAFAPDEPSGRLGKELSQLGRESYLTRMRMADERAKDRLQQLREAPKNALATREAEARIKHSEASTKNIEFATREGDALLQGKLDKSSVEYATAIENLKVLKEQGTEIKDTFYDERTGDLYGFTKYGVAFNIRTKVKLTQEESDALQVEKHKKEQQALTKEMKIRGANVKAQNVNYTKIGTSNGVPILQKEGSLELYTLNEKGEAVKVTKQVVLDGAVKEQKGDFSKKDYINLENQFTVLAVDEKGVPTDKHAILTDPGKQALLGHWQRETDYDYTYFIKQVPKKGWYSGEVTMEPTFMKVQLPIINNRQWTNQMVRESAAALKITYEEALERIAQKQEQAQAAE